MTLADYARSLGVAYKTAWRWWKAGRINGYQLPSRAIFVRSETGDTEDLRPGANTDICRVCKTVLEPSLKPSVPASPSSCPVCGWFVSLADAKSPIERERLNWARMTWEKFQSQSASSREAASRLESRLDALHAQLQTATQERQYLQSQLDWIIEWLDRVNLYFLQENLLNITTPLCEDFESNSRSAVSVDYYPLQELLATQQWQEADAMTRSLILQVTGQQERDWLTAEDIQHFPLADWQTLDWLWYEYSQGRFGFSIQQWVWEQVGGDYGAFCDRVGWRTRENWLYYEDVRFGIDAPLGHLPILGWRKRSCYGVGGGTAAEIMASVATRTMSDE
ncbi:MAG: GUN4 domain-containing protein [Cyanobacteriota bacterium]|nr:GUN4 domain-containing protein [Cyanobacteriota bacterium]